MDYISQIQSLNATDRIQRLKDKMLAEPRYLSLEQARLITQSYQANPDLPRILQRAKSLALVLERMSIRIEPEELIVGNRTPGVKGGVIFPEAGIAWLDREIEGLPTRPQDKFNVRPEDIPQFREEILPYWKGKSLEDAINEATGPLIESIARVVKINQKDHAQGHICPNTENWLKLGPAGLQKLAEAKLKESTDENQRIVFESMIIVLAAAREFIRRYGRLAAEMAEAVANQPYQANLQETARICFQLADQPPRSFHEALQSVWFLFVILQMESNASSFSPGRMDQYLYPYFQNDLQTGGINLEQALELIESLWLKFNQLVYLRNSNSAKYFAGFPIGFNVALGGQTPGGKDASNELSYLFLKAQEHIALSQPNLSARLFRETPDALLVECSRVIGLGSGMPQIFNDESIIPALENRGISHLDAVNYAIVGCVELSTHGNYLGWSDAAMFNLVKALELALNNGKCLLTGEQLGPATGYLTDFKTYAELETAFQQQIDFFMVKMIAACEVVEKIHMQLLPSPFLSSVIDDCLEQGMDVTTGGAHYNLSGIQAIQVANIADSLAAIQKLVYEEKKVSAVKLLQAVRANFEGDEPLRQMLLNHAPKYGNDVEWVDRIGLKWIEYFATQLNSYRNIRGGPYHPGLYTVSAHVPMGQNVGATPDGRLSQAPLADGGMSAVYGRDQSGPTALLKSVSRINSLFGSNGTLLNLKFLPEFFKTKAGLLKFAALLKTFVKLKINHVQFNVVSKEDLIAAQLEPEKYRNLTVRVAGYTAYFTELAGDLQNEIIARTSYGDV
jgi:pyruvate formate-lyase/glycerol dehydratase family glycyl radical enzyme